MLVFRCGSLAYWSIMMQVETLDYEEISTFLSEFSDDDWGFKPTPSASVTRMSPVSKVIRVKKPRRYVRIDILTTRRELAELDLQLQILQEKHELYESLQAAKARCGMNWRRFAARERIQMNHSTTINKQLHKRVSDNNRLIQRIHRLIQRQSMDSLFKTAQTGFRLVSVSDEAHVRQVLRSCLNIRASSQLDSIVQHCKDGPTQDLQMTKWNTVDCGDSCVAVDFFESVVLPFGTPHILNAVNDWPSVSSPGMRIGGSEHGASQVHEQDKRLMLRRIKKHRDCAIVLWEEAFCYQNMGDSNGAMVRTSGWALISPVGKDMSVVYSGGFIQIKVTDRPRLSVTTKFVQNIVEYTQSLQRSRITSLEDVLIDAFHQQM